MKKHFLTPIALIVLFANLSFWSVAQVSEGAKAMKAGNYEKALSYFEKESSRKPHDFESVYKLGVCHLMLHHDEQALLLLENALSFRPELDPEHANYWLGLAYKYNHQPEKALHFFEQHLKVNHNNFSEEEENQVIKLMAETKMAEKHTQEVKSHFTVSPFETGVNSRYAEHNLCFSPDGTLMMFTSARPSNKFFHVDKWGEFYEDIFYAEKRPDGTWGRLKKISGFVKANEHEGIVQILPNHDLLIYKPNRGGDFLLAKKTITGWDKPRCFKEISSSNIESHAFVTADGNRILFSSDRENNQGKLDLFEVHLQADGKWSKAQKLALGKDDPDHDEDFPFLSADNKTLYFSSNGTESMGGFDVFKSTWDEATQSWSTPENMGSPVNSIADDIFYKVNEATNTAYLSSNRKGGQGKTDLYQVTEQLPEMEQALSMQK